MADTATTIRYVDRDGEAGDLGATVNLTDDGRLTTIHTPGHTPGSVTVRLRTDQADIWFTGDTSFTAAGMNPDAPQRASTPICAKYDGSKPILRYAGHTYLPTTRGYRIDYAPRVSPMAPVEHHQVTSGGSGHVPV